MLRTGVLSHIGLRKSPLQPVSTIQIPLSDAGAGAVNVGPGVFTRASNAAARLSTGLWKVDVANNIPRAHYSASGVYLGYLFENAAIQLVTPAASVRDFSDAAWVKTTMTATKTSIGIDGVAASCSRLTATAGNALVLQTLVVAAATRTISFFIKRITGVGNIELTQDGVTFTNISASLNGVSFVQVSLIASQLNPSFGIRIVTNGDAIDVDWAQYETNEGATSPIPLAGARAIDALAYPVTPVTQGVGTLYGELSFAGNPVITGATSSAVMLNNAAANDCRLAMVAQAIPTVRCAINNAGVQTGFVGRNAGIVSDTVYRVALAFSLDDMADCVTGIVTEQDSLGTPPTDINQLIFNPSLVAGVPVCAKNVRVFPTRLSNGQIQVLTN